MPETDFTTVIAVDRAHANQLEIVWPTWRLNKPELLERPIVFLADSLSETGGNDAFWGHRLAFATRDMRSSWCIAYWDWPCQYRDSPCPPEISQRERMLTALVKAAPWCVLTEWWLKLDTDLVATAAGEWFDPLWFNGPEKIISSPWGYSKPANVIQRLDDWGDRHHDFSAFDRLNLPPTPGAEVLRHPRIISWCMFIRTQFSKLMSEWAGYRLRDERADENPYRRLPIPSQDTYHWWACKRIGGDIRMVKFNRLGWSHLHRDSTLRRAVAEVLEGRAVA